MRQAPAPPPMPDPPDRVAALKDGLRLSSALALRGLARADAAGRTLASRLWHRTRLPTHAEVTALRASVTDLTRAVRDLSRA